MRVGLLVLQQFDVLLHGSATIEDSGLHFRHVLAKSCILVLDLVSQLASMAHDKNGAFSRNRLHLLEGSKNEDRGFTETGLGLAENVRSKDGLRDANLLNCEGGPMSDSSVQKILVHDV